MMWQIQILLTWLLTAQGLNMLFAGLSLACACGLCPRWTAVLAGVLYLLLALA